MVKARGGSARAGLWLCRPSLGGCGAKWKSAGQLAISVPGSTLGIRGTGVALQHGHRQHRMELALQHGQLSAAAAAAVATAATMVAGVAGHRAARHHAYGSRGQPCRGRQAWHRAARRRTAAATIMLIWTMLTAVMVGFMITVMSGKQCWVSAKTGDRCR